jgi:hypothetical protein
MGTQGNGRYWIRLATVSFPERAGHHEIIAKHKSTYYLVEVG